MAYFRKIEDAESCLSRGDLLGAEALLSSARELHGQSRFRAPFVERGIDPVLRVGRRLLRRSGEGPVLPNFPLRAARLEDELRKLALRREREASDLALVEDQELRPEHARACEAFLLLSRESRIARIPTAIVWRLLRSYLVMHTERRDGIEADLIPVPFDVPEDQRGWLGEWIRTWIRATDGRPAPLAAALLSWSEHFALDTVGSEAAAGSWSWLSARLSLLASEDGPRALRWGRLALELPLDEEEAWANLRLVASLECNQDVLATSGVEGPSRLHRMGQHPAARGRSWPPRDLEDLLRRRDPQPDAASVVVAQSSPDGHAVLLLRTHREKPVDAVLLELGGGEREPTAFTVSPAQGREAVEAWLHPGDMVLVARVTGGAIEAVVPPERVLAVEELEASLPAQPVGYPPAPESHLHPLFRSQGTVPLWGDLYFEAREVLPRALACLQSDALRSGWGRDNLRRLAAVGLRRCRSLDRLLDILDPQGELSPEVQLQELPLEPRLSWPLLAERPWIESSARLEPPASHLDSDLVIAHRPSIEELATEALALGRVAVLSEEDARSRELAATLAASVDPRQVTWQRHRARCPMPDLRCLGRWIGEAISDPDRELDVLWLYQGLCATPEAAVEAGLDPTQRPMAWREVQSARDEDGATHEGCGPQCALRASPAECWPRQLRERRRQGRLWLGRVSEAEAAESESLLVDDLAGWVDDDDETVGVRLLALRERLRLSSSYVLHADAGAFGDSLEACLREWLPEGRRPLPHTRAWSRSIDVLAVPAGYSPACTLLAQEAESLLAERLRLWDDEVGGSPRWAVSGGADSGDGLRGRAEAPQSKIVLVPRLGGAGPIPGLVQLLRLALASTHSSQSLVCFDPRLADAHPQLLRRVHTPTPLGLGAKALGTGAQVFGARRANRPAQWRHPLDARRLGWALGREDEPASEDRLESLAQALSAWSEHPRLALAAASDEERRAVARLLLELARESRDGAGLSIRRVVWVGDGESPFAPAQDVCDFDPCDPDCLPQDSSRAILLAPSQVGHERVVEWTTGLGETAWILAHAELHLREGVLARNQPLPRIQGDGRLLAFSDDPESDAVAEAVDAFAVRLAPPSSQWTWQRHRAPDHQVQCASCGFLATIEHPLSLCGRCGKLVLKSEECESASRLQRVAGLREQLASGDGEVLVIAVDRAQRDELRHQLGLAILDEDEGSLWDGRSTSQAFGHDVVALADLCSSAPGECRLLLDHLPSDAGLVRALMLRLAAAGWRQGCVEVLDHPLQWHSDRPLRRDAPADPWSELAGRRLRWEASRAEIEFRYAQALAEVRRDLARHHRERGGRFFSESLVRAGNSSHSALLEALRTDDPGRARILANDAELFGRAQHWMSATLDRGAECGLSLDPPQSARLLLSEFAESPLLARRAALLLAWARRERLLSATELEAQASVAPPGLTPRLRRARRGERLPLELDSIVETQLPRSSVPDDDAPTSALPPAAYLSLASTGRSSALQQVARGRSSRGERVLCLVPETAALQRWGLAVHQIADLEVMTVGELAVAIVADAAEEEDVASPRPLPPAGSVVGEEIRQSLLREVSRLYAQHSGRVPPVDTRALRRLLEEEGAVARMASAGDDSVDVDLLRDCIHEARQRHGWLEERDLFDVAVDRIAREEERAEKWRRYFDALLIDDAHAFGESARGLVQRVFDSTPKWSMADPWLVERDDGTLVFEAGRSSARVPRTIAAAMETVARNRPVSGWKLRSSRRIPRGELHCERVLNLEACVRHVHEFVASADDAHANHAVVLGHENDRRQAMLRLREEGHRVWDAEVVTRYAAPGPRDLLALAILVFEDDIATGLREGLQRLVLQSSRWDFSDLAETSDTEEEVTGLADCVAAAVYELRAFVEPGRPLREFHERARMAGLMETVSARASCRHRLEEFLTLAGARPWNEVRHQIDFDAVADTAGVGGVLWCLRPQDLHGLVFDDIFHICSGYEDPTRHLLVASRTRRSLHVLYSEIDPFRLDA